MRCGYVVSDAITRKKRKCKNNNKWIINNVKYCTLHYNLYIHKNVIFIQKIFRGNKCRKNMKYFIRLPDDVQRIIIENIKGEHYIDRYNKSIQTIILNKIDIFIKKHLVKFYTSYYINDGIKKFLDVPFNSHRNFKHIGEELIHLYYLLEKYHFILKNNQKFYERCYIDYYYMKQSMFTHLSFISCRFVMCAEPEVNLEGLSQLLNFNKHFECIKIFPKNYY